MEVRNLMSEEDKDFVVNIEDRHVEDTGYEYESSSASSMSLTRLNDRLNKSKGEDDAGEGEEEIK